MLPVESNTFTQSLYQFFPNNLIKNMYSKINHAAIAVLDKIAPNASVQRFVITKGVPAGAICSMVYLLGKYVLMPIGHLFSSNSDESQKVHLTQHENLFYTTHLVDVLTGALLVSLLAISVLRAPRVLNSTKRYIKAEIAEWKAKDLKICSAGSFTQNARNTIITTSKIALAGASVYAIAIYVLPPLGHYLGSSDPKHESEDSKINDGMLGFLAVTSLAYTGLVTYIILTCVSDGYRNWKKQETKLIESKTDLIIAVNSRGD